MVGHGAGQYNKRVSILKRSDNELDTFGNPRPEWIVEFHRWARIITAGGREFQQASTTVAELTTQVAMRSDRETRTMTPKNRIEMDGRTLEIVSVFDVDAMRVEVAAVCKEIV